MWGTTSFCDELTGDFGGAFEATSIDDCRLFCPLAEIQSHGVLGLLQHNLPIADSYIAAICPIASSARRPLPLKQPFSAAAAPRIAPIEDLGAGDASVYGVSPCTRCMLTMLPLVTTLPAIGD
jgi:hypothetical protein